MDDLTNMDDLISPGQVPIRVPVRALGGVFLPCRDDDESDGELFAIFRTMTYEDYAVIEDIVSIDYEIDDHETVRELDFCGMRYYMMRRLPMVWNVGIPLKYENGWLTDECFSRVRRMPAPLVDAMLDQYQPHVAITDEEEKQINHQAVSLFSENSRGVMNACRAVQMYCLLTSFWEKFGLNVEDIASLPYKDYLLLRQMVSHGNDAQRRRMQRQQNQSKARMVGRGGRLSPGRTVMIPD